MKKYFTLILGFLLVGLSAASAQPTVYPGAAWQKKYPEEVGLDPGKLKEIRDYLGGSGFITRFGYQVYAWGNYKTTEDVASAHKPILSYFLFKAVEDGRLPSLDTKVDVYQPGLDKINAALNYKDRNMTFRNLDTQTSCYGVKEAPGTAFDYSDWQTALYWDTLFTKVYGATIENVDATVLHPLLTDLLQCQDNPTFLPFGIQNRPGRVGISPRDFARFGLLFLRHGNWNGKQLLTAKDADMMVTSPLPNSIPQTGGEAAQMLPGQRTDGATCIPDNESDHEGSYSYMWWINGVDRNGNRFWPDAPTNVYGCLGHVNGKRGMAVMPSQDIVISWNDTLLDVRPPTPQPLNTVLKLLKEAVLPQPGPRSGQIIVDPANPRWLKYKDGGPFFMCGPGDPEGFLYRGTRNPDGTRNGDQMALINKLKGTGANCIYMIGVRSNGGDGGPTENPFVNSDPAQGLDDNILNQWETWFTAMDKANITIFFIFYDDSAWLWKGDTVGPVERNFIDGIVSRFKHHKHLIWCVAEEAREAYSDARIENIAAAIRAADNRRHPIAVHLNIGLNFQPFDDDPNIDQFAVQWDSTIGLDFHQAAVKAWDDSGGRFNVNMAEMHPAPPPDMSNLSGYTGAKWRWQAWECAMGGAYVMHIRMDIASTPRSDLVDCGRVVTFMQSTDFNEMAPHDELRAGGAQYVLANPGHSYIAYARDLSGNIGLKGLTAGTYSFKWLDCVTGITVNQTGIKVPAGEQTWAKPENVGKEVAVYIKRTDS